MTCNREETAYAFLDGELGPREAAEFAQHLAGCSECKILVHETQERERSLRAVLTHLASSCQIAGKVMRRLPAEKILPAPGSAHPEGGGGGALFGWRYLVPAGLTIVVLAWLLSLAPAPGPGPLVPLAVEGITLSALGPEARVDGTVIPADNTLTVLPGRLLQVTGPVAIRFAGVPEAGFTLHGEARFIPGPGTLQWQAGAATFGIAPRSPPVTITLNGHRLFIGEGTLSVGGSSAEGFRVLLKSGRAWLRGPQGASELVPGRPLTLSGTALPSAPPVVPPPIVPPPVVPPPAPPQTSIGPTIPPGGSTSPAAMVHPAGSQHRVATPAVRLATGTPTASPATASDQVDQHPPEVTGPSANPFGDDPVVISD